MDDVLTKALPLVEILWAYNILHQPPRPADLLLVMGTNDLDVPEYAARLAQQFDYKYIVCSGGVVHERSKTGDIFSGTEADIFAVRMVACGIEDHRVFRDNRALNTGENITCTRDLLRDMGVIIRAGQLIHQPYMERRALATAQKQWPEVEWTVSSTAGAYADYIVGKNEERIINSMVGDTYRILAYVDAGYQVPQIMPDDVCSALRQLIELGFDHALPRDRIDLGNKKMPGSRN